MAEVKLEGTVKELLETLLEEVRARNGVRLTAEELISRAIEFAMRRIDEFAEEIKQLPPLEEDPAWKMLQRPVRWGIRDASVRVDECLYGGAP